MKQRIFPFRLEVPSWPGVFGSGGLLAGPVCVGLEASCGGGRGKLEGPGVLLDFLFAVILAAFLLRGISVSM